MTYNAIGKLIGVTRMQAWLDVKAAAEEFKTDAKHEVAVSVGTLDHQIDFLEGEAEGENNKAQDRIAARRGIIAAVSLRADLLGLKAPVRVQVQHGLLDTMTEERANEIIRVAEAKPLTVSARIVEAPPNGNGNGSAH
jgi:hypothetical protein